MTPAIERLLVAAQSKVQAAELLFKEGLYGDAASRAYYAVFHAISALHLSRGQTCSSHAQLIGRFTKTLFDQAFSPQSTRGS
ncbi:HEPN domain-containing protein [uncultured Thiodictyon sp.]|uniref:HEPN domain-containing protein n=1 Tax=uncultured Thiodictyon sp. TaxID=1846217 RepID=UPI0025F1721C|nr:HEPN domain-containing protein [uncultured Thiodictyon sp.]